MTHYYIVAVPSGKDDILLATKEYGFEIRELPNYLYEKFIPKKDGEHPTIREIADMLLHGHKFVIEITGDDTELMYNGYTYASAIGMKFLLYACEINEYDDKVYEFQIRADEFWEENMKLDPNDMDEEDRIDWHSDTDLVISEGLYPFLEGRRDETPYDFKIIRDFSPLT